MYEAWLEFPERLGEGGGLFKENPFNGEGMDNFGTTQSMKCKPCFIDTSFIQSPCH